MANNIKLRIKKADRFIEIVKSMPEPIVEIDYLNNNILAHNKGGIVLVVFEMSSYRDSNVIMEFLIKNKYEYKGIN